MEKGNPEQKEELARICSWTATVRLLEIHLSFAAFFYKNDKTIIDALVDVVRLLPLLWGYTFVCRLLKAASITASLHFI